MRLFDRLAQNAHFVLNKPEIIARLLSNYLRLGLNKNVLRTVDIVLDYRCNLKCSHCYTSDLERAGQKPLLLPEIFLIIDKCCQEGAIHFNIIGGEPTLHEDLFALIHYMHKKPSLISLATNGWMLTREFAQELKQAGLDLVLLSVDSLYAAEHDRGRGKGSHDKAMQALENCMACHLKIFISTILTKENIRNGSVNALAEFCEAKKIPLHVNLPTLFGKWKGRDDLFFHEKDREIVRKMYQRDIVHSCEMSAYFSSECRSGKEKLHVTAYGDVLPCAFVPISFGNITREELSVIRKRMLDFPLLNGKNSMCIPATNRQYHEYIREKLLSAVQVPILYEDVLREIKPAAS